MRARNNRWLNIAARTVGIAVAGTTPALAQISGDKPTSAAGEAPQTIVAGAETASGSIWGTVIIGNSATVVRYVGPDDCSQLDPFEPIALPAFHGVVSVIRRKVSPAAGPNHATCAQDVIYQPDPGFLGYDQFQLGMSFGHRRVTQTVQMAVLRHADDPRPAVVTFSPLELPDGPLLFATATPEAADFIDLDNSRLENGVVSLRYFRVWDPPYPLRGMTVAQTVGDQVIDCSRHTHSDHREYAFDAEGSRVLWSSSNRVETIRAGSNLDGVVMLMCHAIAPPPDYVARGHRAALEMGRAFISKARQAAGR